jgi:uncharacterized protein
MSVELRPLGVRCNISCQYCYQNPQRDAGNVSKDYDVEAMKSAILAEGGPFTMFGGEPLLVPERDLEDLWAWGLQRFGSNGMQTNGTLINDNHVRMFKQYKVHVGISIDGPGELNDVRWVANLEKTREATAKTEAAIERLCKEGIPPSLIVTLHRANATGDKLPRLRDWFRKVERLGVRSARLHILEVEDAAIAAKYALTPEENVEAFLSFADLQCELKQLSFDLFTDMRNLLLGKDGMATCVWRGCDAYTTSAVRGVEGHGQKSNCGRTNKEGIDFSKADVPGYERYVSLYQVPQEFGGCAGCRFFLMCKGQCPGTSMSGDWRSRTEHCATWMALFRFLEDEMLTQGYMPLSTQPDLRKQVESEMIANWSAGKNPAVESFLEGAGSPRPSLKRNGATQGAPASGQGGSGHGDAHGDSHGDSDKGRGGHGDAPHGDSNHGDSGHGDSSHGDGQSHGDHTDHGDRW